MKCKEDEDIRKQNRMRLVVYDEHLKIADDILREAFDATCRTAWWGCVYLNGERSEDQIAWILLPNRQYDIVDMVDEVVYGAELFIEAVKYVEECLMKRIWDGANMSRRIQAVLPEGVATPPTVSRLLLEPRWHFRYIVRGVGAAVNIVERDATLNAAVVILRPLPLLSAMVEKTMAHMPCAKYHLCEGDMNSIIFPTEVRDEDCEAWLTIFAARIKMLLGIISCEESEKRIVCAEKVAFRASRICAPVRVGFGSPRRWIGVDVPKYLSPLCAQERIGAALQIVLRSKIHTILEIGHGPCAGRFGAALCARTVVVEARPGIPGTVEALVGAFDGRETKFCICSEAPLFSYVHGFCFWDRALPAVERTLRSTTATTVMRDAGLDELSSVVFSDVPGFDGEIARGLLRAPAAFVCAADSPTRSMVAAERVVIAEMRRLRMVPVCRSAQFVAYASLQ